MIKFIKKWHLEINSQKKLFIIFTILFSYIIIQNNKICKSFGKYKNITNNSTNANISELNFYLENKENKINIIKNGKKFINNCLNENYFENIYTIDIRPKISSIIPVYNSEKTIYNAICSIQNQNFQDVEIILIDDHSNDSSSTIILRIQERDSRVRLITNKKRMGSLYSRSVGLLLSKGEYIIPLDHDDMFFNYDLFYYLLNLTKKFDFDIIGFRAFQTGCFKCKNSKIIDLYNYRYYI